MLKATEWVGVQSATRTRGLAVRPAMSRLAAVGSGDEYGGCTPAEEGGGGQRECRRRRYGRSGPATFQAAWSVGMADEGEVSLLFPPRRMHTCTSCKLGLRYVISASQTSASLPATAISALLQQHFTFLTLRYPHVDDELNLTTVYDHALEQ